MSGDRDQPTRPWSRPSNSGPRIGRIGGAGWGNSGGGSSSSGYVLISQFFRRYSSRHLKISLYLVVVVTSMTIVQRFIDFTLLPSLRSFRVL